MGLTLVQATETLFRAARDYCSIDITTTVLHDGRMELRARWYVNNRGWSEYFPTLEACLGAALVAIQQNPVVPARPDTDVDVGAVPTAPVAADCEICGSDTCHEHNQCLGASIAEG